MVREVLTINVGQAGIQLGSCVWDQYCAEHGVSDEGARHGGVGEDRFTVFFEETTAGRFVPRNLSVDLEPNCIDDVRNGRKASMFHPENLLAGKEDAANNFARGFYSIGREFMGRVEDRLRALVDGCENVQGFCVQHAVGGGTGSGLGSLILEHIATEYRRKAKLGFEIYPSPTIANAVVEPINALLATQYLCDLTEVSLVLDNEALYELCRRKLALDKPDFENLNRVVAKVMSSLTASLRFAGELNLDVHDIQTNLVAFPRLHFMTSSLAPVMTAAKALRDPLDVQGVTASAFAAQHMLVKLPDLDAQDDPYMAILLNYRGDVRGKDASAAVAWLKEQQKVQLVDWCPTGFKIGLNDELPATLAEDVMAPAPRTATMVGNNTAIARVFHGRLARKFDLMYSQRAFVHWYVGEGMEEGELQEAREALELLEKDYLDVVVEHNSDDDAGDE